ncbi:MAG TPA: PAS domain S-box protein, partial [Polyangiaceae bacterium]|nr:PAS domain S-box protein [Polyangiaceae bacterium]
MAPDDATAPFRALTARASDDGLFRELLEAAPDGVVIVDGAGRIVFANSQAERLFGYRSSELLGQGVELLVPERLRTVHARQRAAYVDAPRMRPMGSGQDLLGRRRDGTEFPIEISLSPLRASEGMLFLASMRDVSERKQAEAASRRLQAHLLSAVESIQGAFAIFDAQDRLVLCNSQYRQLVSTGLSGEAIGRRFIELLPALQLELEIELPGRGLAECWTEYHQRPAGVLPVRTRLGRHLRVVERRTAEGGGVTTISDVTEDFEHEDQLRKAHALAEAASSAKSEFLASMSHELRTPLNAVLGFAQLLQRDRKQPLSGRQLERVEHVLQGGEHLLRLIDDVLDLARIEAGRVLVSPERVDVHEVLSEIQATLATLAARQETRVVLANTPPDAGFVIADRTRLKQVLMNFGSNAIKYGRPHGTVHLRAARHGSGVRISVEDDGFGIPLDKQA